MRPVPTLLSLLTTALLAAPALPVDADNAVPAAESAVTIQPVAAPEGPAEVPSEAVQQAVSKQGVAPETDPEADAEAEAEAEPAPANDVPRYLIQKSNSAVHAAMLSPGQRALLAAMPDSFRLPVHARTAPYAPPSAFAALSAADDGKARLDDNGAIYGLGRGLPFPEILSNDPQGGLKAIWNHLLRWRGTGRSRSTVQAVVSEDGTLSLVNVHERSRFLRGIDADAPQRMPLLTQQMFGIAAPPRLAGNLKLVHESLYGVVKAWQRSPDALLSKLRTTTEAGDDTPVIGSDGLYGEDQREGFSGSPERWRWKLAARHELLVPWAAERFHARDRTLEAVLTARHPDAGVLRYEPRRVLQVDALLDADRSGPWPKRSYYIDEASWQVLLVEFYGRDDRLQRVQEVHVRQFGDVLLPAVEVIYDLPSRRYLVSGLETRSGDTVLEAPAAEDFQPGPAVDWAKSIGAVPSPR